MLDERAWRELPGAREGVPEQLFVREDADGLELALYIAPSVVRALEVDDPRLRLHGGNVLDFWIALEGVSHFVLVASRANAGRPVTPLELEIQAEVDKFVTAWLLLCEQGVTSASAARQVFSRLFAPYALHEPMPLEEADRYHVATRVARRFCSALASGGGRDCAPGHLTREVRRFLGLGMAEKLRAA